MGFIKSTYNFIGFLVTVLIGFFLVAATFACYVSPNSLPIASLITLGYPIILGINMLVLLFWVIQRNKIAFVPLFFMIVTYGAIAIYFPINFGAKSAKGSDNNLSVLTYNTHSFNQLSPHTPKNPNGAIECIKGFDADIVLIQEFAVKGMYYNHKINREKFLYPEEVDSAFLKIYPYCDKNLHSNRYSYTGLALYSKYPITNVVNLFPDKEVNGAMVYTLHVNGRDITIINVHLESNKLSSDDRDLFYTITSNIDKSNLFYKDAKDRLLDKFMEAAKKRADQSKIISDYIATLHTDNLIVCGDFNDTPNSYSYNTIRGHLQDAYCDTGFGIGITYNQDRFYFRIDHILYGAALSPTYSKIDKNMSSDHYPLYAEFAWVK